MSWRDQILREFTPGVARLTLVADPDGLLMEEGVIEGIRERGFELIPFEDHVAFRYAYESRFRSRWDRGEETNLAVLLRFPSNDFNVLPYDLLQAGRKLSFSLSDLFPNLSYSVIAELDITCFDILFDAQSRHEPERLGENATKDFVLRHVFGIAPELIKEPKDLLVVLLRRHYQGQRIPAILDNRFIQVLRQNNMFKNWPLEAIIPDAQAFFAFLQERWPVFLKSLAKPKGYTVNENATDYGFKFKGPTLLPFDHPDVRIYIDNLFLEGLLQPVSHEYSKSLLNTWLAIGIRTNKQVDQKRRVDGLLKKLNSSIPKNDTLHSDWLNFAKTWAELIGLTLDSDTMLSESIRQKIKSLQYQINSTLLAWLKKRYGGLINLPPDPPVMLHHIARFIARYIEGRNKDKAALIVVDGLALDQWIVIRNELINQNSRYRFHEHTVFAWIPTVTSVSRQAVFAGKAPIYFPESIYTTNKESDLWKQFWEKEGLNRNEVAYAKGLNDRNFNEISELLSSPKLRVVGLIINKVDQIMHGMKLGTMGMHNQIRLWVRQSFMTNLIDLLLDKGFIVFLTSDHGNIEATGCGKPAEGSVADLRGERVRVYSDPKLRTKIKNQFPEALEWPPLGLPEDFLPLIAPGNLAFIRKGETLVCHGGISLEELVVPFVQIERSE